MKFLSLLSGKTVNIAPGLKVVPKDEFSRLVSASEVLEEVKEEAIEYRKEVAKKGEELKEQSKKKGFSEGLEKWTDQVKFLEQEIRKVRAEMEKLIASVALKSAKKILGREIELNKETIVDIVSNSLKPVSQHKKVVLYVNKSDLEILEKNKTDLKQVLEQVESFSIQPRGDITPHGVIIETESGIINAQIENLWQKLEIALQSLAKKDT